MITGILIENFKGIRERVEIELRPLTLLFGANSAGKSSVLHALHYAGEVFERHNLDADRTTSGGQFVDLGGFRTFVHGHREEGKVRLGFVLRVEDEGLPDYPSPDDYNQYDHLEVLFRGITSAQVTVTIAWSEFLGRPHVEAYEVGFNGRPFATISSQPGRRGAELASIDLGHPVLVLGKDIPRFAEWDGSEPTESNAGDDSGLAILLGKVRGWTPENTVFLPEFLPQQEDALPAWDQRLSLPTSRLDSSPYYPEEPKDDADREELFSDNQELNAVLSKLIVGPGKLVHRCLQQFRYLGPLRETPSRDRSPPRFPDPSRWACGLGAWDTLESANESFVDTVSQWLGDPDRLNSGYHLTRKRFKELDLADPLVAQLVTGRAFDESEGRVQLRLEDLPTRLRLLLVPTNGRGESIGANVELQPQDVGIGISQVVPVIVTALDRQNGLLGIEQPELHLHPKLQAELADLFIQAAKGDTNHTLILETHSELIPLRIMRRIRNGVDGTLPSHIPLIRSSDVAVYYIECHESATIARQLELSEEGQLLDPWPDGFFEEGFRERFSKG